MFRYPYLLFVGLLVLTGTPSLPAAAATAEELTQVRERIAAVQKSLEADLAERDQLARAVQNVERSIAQVGREVRELRERVKTQSRKVDELKAEQAQAELDLERRMQALRRQLRAAYIIGRNGQTQMLLNLDDAQKVGRVLVYYDYLQRAQTTAIQAITARSAELETLREHLRGELDGLGDARSEQESALAKLRSERNKRAEVLKQLRQRIADEKSDLERLQADERSIKKLIESVQESFSDLPPESTFSDKPFASLRGKLPWPVRGKLLAHYGETKAGGRLSWNGHWIAANEGSAVRAVARGRVAYVGWMHRYGLIVLVEHEGSYYSLYGHAQAASVAVGDPIKAGQIIASAGTTGGHDQAGVYFELRKGTQPINPKLWLAR